MQIVQSPRLDQLLREVVGNLQVLEAYEAAVLYIAVRVLPVVAGIVHGTGHGRIVAITILAPAIVHRSTLVVGGEHVLQIHTSQVDHLIAETIGETSFHAPRTIAQGVNKEDTLCLYFRSKTSQ